MSARVGSLFSGYGGLDLGLMSVIDCVPVWHCEFDEAPSKVLDFHWPDVPNFGDVTAVDWAAVEPVDILTGGFPCQDVSLAGRRAGMKEGTRSGLWSEFAKAIDVLRPGLVVIENVRGLLSAAAGGDVESCAWCLGDDPGEPALRALGAVLGELADLGYDAEWTSVRASDAGAPHGRFRVFVVAYPSGGRSGGWPSESEPTGSDYAVVGSGAGGAGAGTVVADSGCDESERRRELGAVGGAASSREGVVGERERVRDAARGGRENATDADADDEFGHGAGGAWRGWAELANGGATLADAESGRRGVRQRVNVGAPGREVNTLADDSDATSGAFGTSTQWGEYSPAIRRWEHATSRLAPSPTVADGRDGQHRLSAPFVEWMMGLPEGWVTASEIGLTRNQQLRALGNGVVPQQAALALRDLLGVAA